MKRLIRKADTMNIRNIVPMHMFKEYLQQHESLKHYLDDKQYTLSNKVGIQGCFGCDRKNKDRFYLGEFYQFNDRKHNANCILAIWPLDTNGRIDFTIQPHISEYKNQTAHNVFITKVNKDITLGTFHLKLIQSQYNNFQEFYQAFINGTIN